MSEFEGFGPKTIQFIKGLSKNNKKEWFDEHRADYDTHYIEPAKDFITAIGPKLEKLSPGIHAIPKVNGSIFRINRDIRFSKDKTPYKDHLDLWFWEGDRKTAISGMFFRLTKDKLILGVGAHGFPPDRLKAYREALDNKAKASALLAVDEALAESGLELKGEHYAKVPRGLSFVDPKLERLSKYNALYTSTETAHPDALGSAEFVDYCIDKWRTMTPLHRWLVDQLG